MLLLSAGDAPTLQVASQSAVSQEQVDNILQENDALRTNLAALEQVTYKKKLDFWREKNWGWGIIRVLVSR